MFTSNDNFTRFDIHDTKIFFKDIHAKRMDFVKIIGINKNFMRTIFVTFYIGGR